MNTSSKGFAVKKSSGKPNKSGFGSSFIINILNVKVYKYKNINSKIAAFGIIVVS
ncbi:hypothetical protein [Pedobacter ghigonis]|uniref:hypothetical protein n=1 Tax=Pedobacter ghigonis TaxID=2730403 RepID=UPI00158CADF2|nr:hypothetical protein [Pedobacter ghigonis]